jgi:iron complex transport system ATP-binding protein
MNNQTLLQFDHVDFKYPRGQKLVLEGFNLDITPGSITAVLGANGAGKTTLLHLALGWLRPQGGAIRMGGKKLQEYTRRSLGQQISLVPQGEKMTFEFSLLEYVLLGRSPYLNPLDMPREEDVEIAHQSLEQVGLGDYSQRSIMNLSGGERQLVFIARTLAQQPKLLLLDEPSSYLDLGNKRKVVDLMRKLNQQGVTILLTTHDPEVVSALANSLILVENGRVQKSGTMEEVFTSEHLSKLYHTPIRVLQIDNTRFVRWD